MKTKILLLLALLFPLGIIAQEDMQNQKTAKAWALNARISTNGYGGELVYLLSEHWAVRAGYETLQLSIDLGETEQSGVAFKNSVDYNVGAINLMADYYLGRIFYITAGAGLNQFNPGITAMTSQGIHYGDIEYTAEEFGELNYSFEPSLPISPYVGIGIGRTIPANKRIGINFEIGSYYQGPIKVSIDATGAMSETANSENGQAERMEDLLKSYVWLPVVRLGISFKLNASDK